MIDKLAKLSSPVPVPSGVAADVALSSMLIIAALSFTIGGNIAYSVDSLDKADVNETMERKLIGVNGEFDEFPDDSNVTTGDTLAHEAIEKYALVPVIEYSIVVMDWSAGFVYSNKDVTPMWVFQSIPFSLLIASIVVMNRRTHIILREVTGYVSD